MSQPTFGTLVVVSTSKTLKHLSWHTRGEMSRRVWETTHEVPVNKQGKHTLPWTVYNAFVEKAHVYDVEEAGLTDTMEAHVKLCTS
ncbi:hypothetical protein E3N88_45218 [Mikania micrantha]|uniref:Uncharacterized protein n=1 Tax=Mikania micrantha TaxID=192012 RepID=A0A5N6LAG7_9ASTR|nr:hypothetical protein E3N88_45218 [Mikania micrantha]